MAVGLAIAGAVALGTSIWQGIRARRARKRAEALLKQGRMMDSSEDLRKNLRLAQDLKNSGGMGRAEYTTASNSIQRNAATALNSLKGRRQALAGVSRIQQASDDATAKLDAQNSAIARENKLRGTQLEMNVNAALSQDRARKIERDYFIPAQMASSESQALTGAAIQNIGNLAMAAAQMRAASGGNGVGGGGLSGKAPGGGDSASVSVVKNFKIPEFRVKAN